jgi:hypothetical protein
MTRIDEGEQMGQETFPQVLLGQPLTITAVTGPIDILMEYPLQAEYYVEGFPPQQITAVDGKGYGPQPPDGTDRWNMVEGHSLAVVTLPKGCKYVDVMPLGDKTVNEPGHIALSPTERGVFLADQGDLHRAVILSCPLVGSIKWLIFLSFDRGSS